MPLSWCISHPIRLVIAVAKGEFDPQDMVEFVLHVDAANARPYRKMIDVTGVTTRFSADRIRRFARVIRQREEESEVGPIGAAAGSPGAHRQRTLFPTAAQRHQPTQAF